MIAHEGCGQRRGKNAFFLPVSAKIAIFAAVNQE